MKKIIGVSLVAIMALSSLQAVSNAELVTKLNSLEKQLKKFKKKLKKQNKKINTVRAHDAGDNIKWNVDFRTSIDNITYDMADGSTQGKKDLMSNRLWLNMAYSPDNTNIFKAQLSYNKAFGADFKQTPNSSLNPFGVRGTGLDTFDWVTQEALTDGSLKVRQAYWLYLGESMGDLDIPWTMSVGRRPSTGGFLASLRNDDPAQSPLGHIINVEFDGISSKIDFSNVTGIQGLSFKLCAGQGSTNATPRMGNLAGTDYANDDAHLNDTKLAGFIIEPYNDGQYIVKVTGFRAFDMPGFDSAGFTDAFQGNPASFTTVGDMLGGAVSILVDGLTDDGFLADVKLFGSYAMSQTIPDGANAQMLGFTHAQLGHIAGAKAGDHEAGYSVYVGAQLPVTEDGKFGIEFNHGSEYWRSYTYAEDTFAGSKLAARGNAFEGYFTYQLSSSLSAQLRYTNIDYDYTGSNGFFASGGTPFDIDDMKSANKKFKNRGLTQADMGSLEQAFGIFASTGDAQQAQAALTQATGQAIGAVMQELELNPQTPEAGAQAFAQAGQTLSVEALKSAFASQVVEKAQDIRFYIRYRF